MCIAVRKCGHAIDLPFFNEEVRLINNEEFKQVPIIHTVDEYL